MTFTAGGGADGTAPVLVSTSPAGGTLGVAVNPIVRLQFNEPMDVVALGSAITVTGGGSPAAGSLSFSGDHTQLIFTPAGLLAPRAGCTGTATGVEDVGGNPAERGGNDAGQWSDQCAEQQQPDVDVQRGGGPDVGEQRQRVGEEQQHGCADSRDVWGERSGGDVHAGGGVAGEYQHQHFGSLPDLCAGPGRKPVVRL